METHFYAAVLSDVLDEMGLRNQVIDPALGIGPLRQDFVIAGRAATMVNDANQRTDDPYELAIKAIDQLTENSLLVTTWKQEMNPGIMGELTATAMRARKSRGAFVNGFTRDARKMLDADFPIFAKGVSPIDTTGRSRVVDYDCDIQVGGVTIHSGDIFFADYDGALVIPQDAEDKVISETIERVNQENKVRNHLAAGGTMAEAWKKYGVL